VTDPVQRAIALGGILGSVLTFLGALWLYFKSPVAKASAILAGTLTTPLFYVVRFLVVGRGHDATEFQEAQAALGLSYSGHALDWFFLIALIAIALIWLLKSRTRPGLHLLWKCLKGAALGVLLLAGLQMTNNMIFDPIFEHKQRNSAQGSEEAAASCRLSRKTSLTARTGQKAV
jgi:glucan phosphoethanolaminetransferase (alkaline phosphatase superfamily)